MSRFTDPQRHAAWIAKLSESAKHRQPRGAHCSIEGCEKPVLARTWCSAHYERFKMYGDPLGTAPPRYIVKNTPCIIADCGRLQKALGYCSLHLQRYRKHGDPLVTLRGPRGDGTILREGYRLLFLPDHPDADLRGRVYEHRYVMSQMLKRRLFPDETVHHRNGLRADNRPENLELWVNAHHSGQRVEEMLAWAHELIRRYENGGSE